MLNQKALSKLAKGEAILHFLIVRKCEVKTSNNTNKPFLYLEIGDQLLTLPAYMWDNYEEIYAQAGIGSVVKIAGVLDEYRGQTNIKIGKIRCANHTDNVFPEDFMPKSKRDPGEMENEILARIERMNNSCLKELLRLILSGDSYNRYLKAPAGKSWHHSYLHGLLEHTLEIIRICDLMCDIHPEANRDLLISGAILHDFGKIEELVYEQVFDYSDKGKLLGHIVIATMELHDKARMVPGFPEGLKNQLMHLILSHQGKLEFASPVTPKTLESIILYQADELSAKTNAYKSALLADANGNNRWTKYLPLISSSLYIPEDFEKVNNLTNETLY
ncbi:MAG: 3'-5' exoribonuclease YhaM family protein [Ignavibacteriales bacterium]